MISQSDLFKLFRMISRRVISCDECALRFYVCSIFVDRVFVLFTFHHEVHWTYKCFAYVAPRGWIWVRRGLCGFGDIRGSVGRYDPWGIKAAGFAITTKINHYAALTLLLVHLDSCLALFHVLSPPRLRQRPARRTYRPRRTTGRRPRGTTPHQPDRRRDRQNCHLPVAQPRARAPARIRHAPPPWRAPHSPRTRGVNPSRRPWREATPEGHRRRRTMTPNRLHRQPNRSSESPRLARKKCRGPHSGRQHQHQWGSLAGERTGRQCRVPTRRTKRHTEATRHWQLASLTRNPSDQLRTPSVRTAPTDPQPQITRAPPPWRTWHFVQTQARRGGRRSEIHRKPTQGQRPGKPHPTRPGARPREERHPTDATATTTPSMPSWVPAGVTPGGPSTGGATRPPGAATPPGGRYTPQGTTTGTPPARLHRPGAGGHCG